MDAILLCMKKSGIRFFKNIKFPNTEVIRFHAKDNFLGLLRSRTRDYDNVLLMAHGSNNAILTTTLDPNHHYTTYISANDANAFKNDFVFAVSCLTANEFGKRCVDVGAIAYLGYQVEIGCIFSSYSSEYNNMPKRICNAVDTIIKHIFLEELSCAYEEFLRTPISVQTLKERFSFLLEKRIAQLLNMDIEQLHDKYNISITERDYKKYVVEIVLRVLSYLDDILPRLICLGDSNYISSSYIAYQKRDGKPPKTISAELEENYFFNLLHHTEYKAFLRELVNKA